MPNHAANILTITGPTDSVLYFVDKVSGGTKTNFDFNSVLPIPEELANTTSPVRIGLGITQKESDDLIEKYGYNNWYDWKLANWGTKWGAYDVGEWEIVSGQDGKSIAKVFYNTAWSPASRFLLNVSKEYKDLTFDHIFSDEEGGAGFVGRESFEAGFLTSEYEPKWDSPDGIAFRDELGTNSFEDYEEEDSVNKLEKDCEVVA